MPDEQLRGLEARGQGLGGRHQVLHVGGQARVGEITAALTQAGEVEAQDTDPVTGENPGDMVEGLNVLGAGEAVGEEGIGDRLAVGRQIQPGRQPLAGGIYDF